MKLSVGACTAHTVVVYHLEYFIANLLIQVMCHHVRTAQWVLTSWHWNQHLLLRATFKKTKINKKKLLSLKPEVCLNLLSVTLNCYSATFQYVIYHLLLKVCGLEHY